MIKDKKILIIGGNRFVGKSLVDKLISFNTLDLFNRSGTGSSYANIIKGDRNDINDLLKINFKKYDCIVDMCLYKLEQFKLIKDLIPDNINYVFISSGAVDYTKAFGEYGVEKKNIEKALTKTNINYKIIRPSYIVGEGDHIGRLSYFISKLNNKDSIEISGDGNYPINIVFVQDVVKCLLSVIGDNRRTYKSYYICGDESITINELISLFKKELNIKNHTIIDSDKSLFYNQSFEFNNSDIKEDYNLNFTDLKISLKQYIERYNEY